MKVNETEQGVDGDSGWSEVLDNGSEMELGAYLKDRL